MALIALAARLPNLYTTIVQSRYRTLIVILLLSKKMWKYLLRYLERLLHTTDPPHPPSLATLCELAEVPGQGQSTIQASAQHCLVPSPKERY